MYIVYVPYGQLRRHGTLEGLSDDWPNVLKMLLECWGRAELTVSWSSEQCPVGEGMPKNGNRDSNGLSFQGHSPTDVRSLDQCK